MTIELTPEMIKDAMNRVIDQHRKKHLEPKDVPQRMPDITMLAKDIYDLQEMLIKLFEKIGIPIPDDLKAQVAARHKPKEFNDECLNI